MKSWCARSAGSTNLSHLLKTQVGALFAGRIDEKGFMEACSRAKLY
jgi:hypothetical protein